jgi:hypothetical protein
MKKRTKVLLIVLSAVLALAVLAVVGLFRLVWLIASPGHQLAREQTIRTASYDGRYTLVEEWRRADNHVMEAHISVENAAGEVMYTCPDVYRTWDYHGTRWGPGTLDIYALSGDIGTYCYRYQDGAWLSRIPADYKE